MLSTYDDDFWKCNTNLDVKMSLLSMPSATAIERMKQKPDLFRITPFSGSYSWDETNNNIIDITRVPHYTCRKRLWPVSRNGRYSENDLAMFLKQPEGKRDPFYTHTNQLTLLHHKLLIECSKTNLNVNNLYVLLQQSKSHHVEYRWDICAIRVVYICITYESALFCLLQYMYHQ